MYDRDHERVQVQVSRKLSEFEANLVASGWKLHEDGFITSPDGHVIIGPPRIIKGFVFAKGETNEPVRLPEQY